MNRLDFESRIRKWKQTRLGSWNRHVFTHRSTSIEPRSRVLSRLNVGTAEEKSPRSTPLPRRFFSKFLLKHIRKLYIRRYTVYKANLVVKLII